MTDSFGRPTLKWFERAYIQRYRSVGRPSAVPKLDEDEDMEGKENEDLLAAQESGLVADDDYSQLLAILDQGEYINLIPASSSTPGEVQFDYYCGKVVPKRLIGKIEPEQAVNLRDVLSSMGITMIWRTKKHPSISYGNYRPILGYDGPRVINPFVPIEVYQRDMDAQRYEKIHEERLRPEEEEAYELSVTYANRDQEQELEPREVKNNIGTNQATSPDRVSPFADFEKNIRQYKGKNIVPAGDYSMTRVPKYPLCRGFMMRQPPPRELNPDFKRSNAILQI